MKEYFVRTMRKPKNSISVIIGAFIFFLLLRVFPVYQIIKTSYRIPTMTIYRKIDLFVEYIFKSFIDISFAEQFLIVMLALLMSLNILFFILFIKKQRKVLSGKGFIPSFLGMFMGLFGVGCISCGAFILAPVLGFIGLGAYINGISQHALLLSYVGLIFVLISIFYLVRKLSAPQVCIS